MTDGFHVLSLDKNSRNSTGPLDSEPLRCSYAHGDFVEDGQHLVRLHGASLSYTFNSAGQFSAELTGLSGRTLRNSATVQHSYSAPRKDCLIVDSCESQA